MKLTFASASLVLATACLGPATQAAAPKLPSSHVAWLPADADADADADVDRIFASAKAQNKPVLLYWGDTWCPPCSQLKSTLFNRQDSAALCRSFVAVHTDGDRPGARKLGTRVKVSGYPTVVRFTPQGQEITRLPGEADAAQVMAVLQNGMAGGRPLKAVLADALGRKPLGANDWRMLVFHSWETSEEQLLPKADPTLSGGDRMGALCARVTLARLETPKAAMQVQLPAPLLKDVPEHVALADREITDGYERMAFITFGGGVLARAGLWAQSDALLKANLGKTLTPHHLMSQLGGNACKLGRTEEALLKPAEKQAA